MSDDGRDAIVVIAMIGNPFSPRYARARSLAGPEGVDARDFAALNVALYGARARAWSLTERDASAVRSCADGLAIGGSAVEWSRSGLTIRIDERPAPWGGAVRGSVRVTPESDGGAWSALDSGGAHSWRPIAPMARVEVRMTTPNARWSGEGYVDANAGDEPLERAFRRWTWWRVRRDGRVAIAYHATLLDGGVVDRSRVVDAFGRARPAAIGETIDLGRTRWGLERRAEPGARVASTLEDTPFYARSLLHTRGGTAVHEELSMDRFAARWVRALLPFRMRREVAA